MGCKVRRVKTVLRKCIEKYSEKYNEMCPVRGKNIKIRDVAPWFSTKVLEVEEKKKPTRKNGLEKSVV